MEEIAEVMAQRQSKVVEVKNNAGEGSLGLAMLTSYSSDSEDSIENNDGGLQKEQTMLLPNPFFNKQLGNIKHPNSGIKALCQNRDGSDVCMDENNLKKTFAFRNGNGTSSQPTDFRSIVAVEPMNLSVDDFLNESQSYTQARPVKIELGSGTEDEDSDSNSEIGDSGSEKDYEEGAAGGSSTEDSLKKRDGPRVKGEMGLNDLPPIQDLHISVPHEECKPIGVIKSVVNPLVIVEAHLNTPALDLDSVLFLDEGDRALGYIFDVIGPVKQPIYCVRFNSKEHIEKNKVEVGMPVYCAPKTPYTTFVFLAQLRKLKGSDASWVNDVEPPAEEVEFSDDEMERFAKKKKRNRKFAKGKATEEDAMYREDEHETANNFRGKKRNYDCNTNVQTNHVGRHSVANKSLQPPFIPPMVPGFFRFDNNMAQRFPRPGFPFNSNGSRGGMYRHRLNNHNRPFNPNRPNPRGPGPMQRPPEMRPWCPPQWQPNSSQSQPHPGMNFNFQQRNQYEIAFYAPPRPSPPPPPPPPGSF